MFIPSVVSAIQVLLKGPAWLLQKLISIFAGWKEALPSQKPPPGVCSPSDSPYELHPTQRRPSQPDQPQLSTPYPKKTTPQVQVPPNAPLTRPGTYPQDHHDTGRPTFETQDLPPSPDRQQSRHDRTRSKDQHQLNKQNPYYTNLRERAKQVGDECTRDALNAKASAWIFRGILVYCVASVY